MTFSFTMKSSIVTVSSAALQGWPAVILNDQLHIRFYVPLPTPTSPTAATPAAPPIAIQTPQQQVLDKLMYVTRLKPDLAKQCLDENAWSYDKAVTAFLSLQVSVIRSSNVN